MMQVAVDEIVHMVAMRHGGMPTARPVHMVSRMGSTGMLWRAHVGVGRRDSDHVLIHMVPVRVVQMTVMKVVDMAFVHDGHVPALRTMLVIVVLMVSLLASCHGVLQ